MFVLIEEVGSMFVLIEEVGCMYCLPLSDQSPLNRLSDEGLLAVLNT